MNAATMAALGVLSVAGLVALARVLRPDSTLIDRIIGLDLLLLIVVGGVGVFAARTGDGIFFDLFVVAGLLGFVSTIAVARYIENDQRR